jgi:hypothetical protein
MGDWAADGWKVRNKTKRRRGRHLANPILER